MSADLDLSPPLLLPLVRNAPAGKLAPLRDCLEGGGLLRWPWPLLVLPWVCHMPFMTQRSGTHPQGQGWTLRQTLLVMCGGPGPFSGWSLSLTQS